MPEPTTAMMENKEAPWPASARRHAAEDAVIRAAVLHARDSALEDGVLPNGWACRICVAVKALSDALGAEALVAIAKEPHLHA